MSARAPDQQPRCCEWFLLCENEATTERPHPILGHVPICARCDAKMDRIEGRQA